MAERTAEEQALSGAAPTTPADEMAVRRRADDALAGAPPVMLQRTPPDDVSDELVPSRGANSIGGGIDGTIGLGTDGPASSGETMTDNVP